MRALTVAGWALIALAVVVLWAASQRFAARVVPRGSLLAAVLANRAARAVVLVGWMFAGWHFFAR